MDNIQQFFIQLQYCFSNINCLTQDANYKRIRRLQRKIKRLKRRVQRDTAKTSRRIDNLANQLLLNTEELTRIKERISKQQIKSKEVIFVTPVYA
jgi:hypothetical protein